MCYQLISIYIYVTHIKNYYFLINQIFIILSRVRTDITYDMRAIESAYNVLRVGNFKGY